MEKHVLSKSTFIRGVQCLKSLYLHKKRPFLRDRLSAVQRAKFKRGADVGVLAQQLFPGGINLKPKSPSQYRKAVAATEDAIKDGSINVIYEAGFQYDGVIVFLDVLVRVDSGWRAYEVKSSKKISETYLTDAALQYFVITNSGLHLNDFSIVYIDENYRLDEMLEISALFKTESVLTEICRKQDYIKQQILKEKEVLQLKHSPRIDIGPHCYHPYPCDFIGHCWKHVPTPSIFDLLGTYNKLAYQLHAEGKTIFQDEEIISTLGPEEQKLASLLRINTEKTDCDSLRKVINAESKGRLYFVQMLMNRPSIPHQKGYRPYQAIPAAISVLFSDGGSSEIRTKIFRFDENVEQAFLEFCSIIFNQPGTVFTYTEHIRDFMYWFSKHTKVDEEDFDFFNLIDIPNKHSYFHPELFPDHTIDNLKKFLNRDLKTGHSENLLLMDYNAAYFTDSFNKNEILQTTIEDYLVSCVETQRFFYNFIRAKCGTES